MLAVTVVGIKITFHCLTQSLSRKGSTVFPEQTDHLKLSNLISLKQFRTDT